MRLRFGFGLLHIGRPSGIGLKRDASLTLCLGRRKEVPPGELGWHRIYRFSWNWLPDRRYLYLRSPGSGIDSTSWTGRKWKFLGFGKWRRELMVYRTTW